jgi:hypothetical protein
MLLWVLCLGFLTLGQADAAQESPPAKFAAGASFDALKSLAGTWIGTVKTTPTNPDLDGPIQVTIRVASQGNALVHEMAPGGIPEPTLIYLDDGRLTLVHYCDAGNRPRLVAHRSTDPRTTGFEFVDISGSKSPLYLQQFAFNLADADHHTEDMTFMMGGAKQLRAHFDLKRTSGSAPAAPSK